MAKKKALTMEMTVDVVSNYLRTFTDVDALRENAQNLLNSIAELHQTIDGELRKQAEERAKEEERKKAKKSEKKESKKPGDAAEILEFLRLMGDQEELIKRLTEEWSAEAPASEEEPKVEEPKPKEEKPKKEKAAPKKKTKSEKKESEDVPQIDISDKKAIKELGLTFVKHSGGKVCMLLGDSRPIKEYLKEQYGAKWRYTNETGRGWMFNNDTAIEVAKELGLKIQSSKTA